MRVSQKGINKISGITIDSDINLLDTYQLTNLAPPASGEALRKGNKDIGNAEVADAAAIVYSKLNLALGIRNADVKADAAIALSKLHGDVCSEAEAATLIAAAFGARLGAVSANLCTDNATDRTKGATTSYVKFKEIKIDSSIAGLRVKYEVEKSSSAATTGTCKLTKNGTLVGSEHDWTTQNVEQAFENDLTSLVADDLIAVWIKASAATANLICRGMSLYYAPLSAVTIQDP